MAAGWQVTGQVADQFDIDGAGNPVPGFRVSFLTSGGNRGSVFVPESRYDVHTVRTLIAAQAEKMDAVSALTAGS